METLGNQILPNSAFKFYCENCDYGTSKKSSFDDHNLSSKHQNGNKMETNGNAILPSFCCEKCKKNFSTRSGLWKHKKKCNNTVVTDSNAY